MLAVFDDFLSQEERTEILNFFNTNRSFWIDLSVDREFNKFVLGKILNQAGKLFDLSEIAGVECWSHFNTRSGWHSDKDENHYRSTKEIKTPICSIVYYAEVNNLTNGKFVTATETIIPITNRLLIFSPGIEHGVQEFSGQRTSLAINPWNYKIQKDVPTIT